MPLLDLVDLTPGQRVALDAIHFGSQKTIVWVGSIRSGKTSGLMMGLVELCLKNKVLGEGNNEYILAGPTLGGIRRITRAYVSDVCQQYGLAFRDVGGDAPHYQIGQVAKIHLSGADKASSYARIAGMTVHSAVIDEATLCHEDFLETVFQRCSFDSSLVMMGTNADSPFHPVKTKYIDEADEDTLIIESTFYENQHYSDVRRRVLEKQNTTGHIYRRNILNQWTPASGLVMPVSQEMVVARDPTQFGDVGFDLGIEGTTVALLVAPQGNGWHVSDEYYHVGRRDGVLTDEEHLQRITSRWAVGQWVIDPSAVSFRAVARRNGQMVYNGQNDVIPGIQVVNNLLQGGRLTIDPRCRNLLGEMAAYAWNTVTDKPIKKQDHGPDALRYLAMHVAPPGAAMIYGR